MCMPRSVVIIYVPVVMVPAYTIVYNPHHCMQSIMPEGFITQTGVLCDGT